jgi:signal peptidase
LWYQAHDERIIMITSGSMGSSFHDGDAVVVNQVVDPSQLRVGQVVTFTYDNERTGDASLLTHRIIGFVSLPETTPDGRPKIDPATGTGRLIRYIRTRADGTQRADAQLTEITKIRGVVLEVKHNWGLWLAWARSPAGKLALFVPPLALLMLAESRTWRRARPVLKRQPA